MKKILLSLGLVVATTAMCLPTETNAQLLRNHREAKAARRAAVSTRAVYAGRDVEGLTITNDPGIVTPFHSAAWALHDPYNPHPYYAYSCRGIKAGLTHGWNQEQMGIRPWHGNYNYLALGRADSAGRASNIVIPNVLRLGSRADSQHSNSPPIWAL